MPRCSCGVGVKGWWWWLREEEEVKKTTWYDLKLKFEIKKEREREKEKHLTGIKRREKHTARDLVDRTRLRDGESTFQRQGVSWNTQHPSGLPNKFHVHIWWQHRRIIWPVKLQSFLRFFSSCCRITSTLHRRAYFFFFFVVWDDCAVLDAALRG